MKGIYIVDYTNGTHTVHGPYDRICVLAIHTSIPKIQPDTITFSVHDKSGSGTLTVSMVHDIVTNPNQED